MLIFLDTEFTDFIEMQLISIGLVTDDNRQFYAEMNDFDLARCSDFVKDEVLPKLGKSNANTMNAGQLQERLGIWLSQFEGHDPVICFDSDRDETLLQIALGECHPSWLKHKNVYEDIDQDIAQQYYHDAGLLEHHALNDALANQFAYRGTI